MADVIGQIYLTRPLVAARYSVSERTVARWQVDPDLRFPEGIKINNRHLFAIVELEAWERSRAAPSQQKAA